MKLEDFTRGWIVGDFEPSIVKTKDVEIGIIELKAGEESDGHFHKEHKEFNLVLSGVVGSKRGVIYFEGDFFTFFPNEESDIFCLKDAKLLVVKTPATKGDKHYA